MENPQHTSKANEKVKLSVSYALFYLSKQHLIKVSGKTVSSSKMNENWQKNKLYNYFLQLRI
jgi:hypothetical protein